jgi:hypothetical protein
MNGLASTGCPFPLYPTSDYAIAPSCQFQAVNSEAERIIGEFVGYAELDLSCSAGSIR